MALQSKTPTEESAKKHRDRELLTQIFVGQQSIWSKLEVQLEALVGKREGTEINWLKLNPAEQKDELKNIVKAFDEMRSNADMISDPVVREGVKILIIDRRGDFSGSSDFEGIVKLQAGMSLQDDIFQNEVNTRMMLLPTDVLADVETRMKTIDVRISSLLDSYDKLPSSMTEQLSELERYWVKPALSMINSALSGTAKFGDFDMNSNLSESIGHINIQLNSEKFKEMAKELEPGLRHQVDEMAAWSYWMYKTLHNEERLLDLLQDKDYWASRAPIQE